MSLEKSSSKNSVRAFGINMKKISRTKPKPRKQHNRRATKLAIRSPIHTTFKKKIRHQRKRRAIRRKPKRRQCTSKTLSKITKSS